MLRLLVTAGVFVVGGAMLAGCGGSSLQQIARRQAKEMLGDPHARVLRVEVVRIVNGSREAVVQMQGRFNARSDAPLASPTPSYSRYAVVDFSLPNPRDSQGFWIPAQGELAAITRARDARPLFSIFPDFMNFTIRCAIPHGGPAGGTVQGTCVTETIGSNHVRQVKFLEHWPLATSRTGAWPAYEKSGGWIVTLDQRGRVASIQVTGHLPPQLAK